MAGERNRQPNNKESVMVDAVFVPANPDETLSQAVDRLLAIVEKLPDATVRGLQVFTNGKQLAAARKKPRGWALLSVTEILGARA